MHGMFLCALDIIAPRKERAMRAENWTIDDLMVYPKYHYSCGIRITTILDYRTPAVEDCIRSLKYDRSSRSALLLADTLADYLREEISEVAGFSPRPILLVPIPLFKTRKRERGFNQIESILNKLPRELLDGTLATFAPHVLVRAHATKQQTRLARQERLRNMSGAFFVPNVEYVLNKHIFLIDDVTTTGATLAEASRTLHVAGAGVSALALARA
jgi:ComF family protein